MKIILHPHAKARLAERGATVAGGERFPAKFGRVGFRRNFSHQSHWRGKFHASKQIIAFAASEPDGWLVITAIVKYF